MIVALKIAALILGGMLLIAAIWLLGILLVIAVDDKLN